jgi:hypothetical protein
MIGLMLGVSPPFREGSIVCDIAIALAPVFRARPSSLEQQCDLALALTFHEHDRNDMEPLKGARRRAGFSNRGRGREGLSGSLESSAKLEYGPSHPRLA